MRCLGILEGILPGIYPYSITVVVYNIIHAGHRVYQCGPFFPMCQGLREAMKACEQRLGAGQDCEGVGLNNDKRKWWVSTKCDAWERV
jgi:hypothetical protein